MNYFLINSRRPEINKNIISGSNVHIANVASSKTSTQIKTATPITITNERIKNPKMRINVFNINTSKNAFILKPFLYDSSSFCQGEKSVLASTPIEKK